VDGAQAGQIRASAEETALMVPSAARLSRRYGELTLPVVIMAGEADRVVTTAAQSLRLHEELQGSGFHAVPGVGHMIQHIVPDAVLKAIDEAAERGAARLGLAA
jgi:pimeloyl-ACP methyl ester carboxylesterase